MKNVLVVGCGITGSTIANLLRKATGQLQLEVWDKGRRPAGRFTTYLDERFNATCDMVRPLMHNMPPSLNGRSGISTHCYLGHPHEIIRGARQRTPRHQPCPHA
jgi:hypothetical protein